MKNVTTVILAVFFAFSVCSPAALAGNFGGGKKGKAGGMKRLKERPALDQSEDAPNPEMRGAFMAMRANTEDMEARGFFETGLRPIYPTSLSCPSADSFFGSNTRGNDSIRSQKFYQGRHGGLDIPAKDINIIAVSDGEVIEKGEGENIGGIKVVLRHSPEQTGLDVWTFTEYKHLKAPSPLSLHSTVRQGDVVGVAWNTGTTSGRAYGPLGHYHLHMSAWYNNTGDYKVTPKMLIPKDGYWLDPLAMMRGMPVMSAVVKDLPEEDKRFRIAYKTTDGSIHPDHAKVIWPFVCN